MPGTPKLRKPTDAEIDRCADFIQTAFAAGPVAGCKEWLTKAGVSNVRVLATDGAPPRACLLRIEMGQYFGGRSIPMLGIAGVAVPPESRGRGTALELMRACVREGAADGFPLSVLYASTQTLYRKVGYEAAGHACRVTFDLSDIGVRDHAMSVRRLTDADDEAVRACYAAFAPRFDGLLDRGPYVWGRKKKFRDDMYTCYGVEGPSGLEGYTYVSQTRSPVHPHFTISANDLVFTTPAAGRRLLTLLADFSTVGDSVTLFFVGPNHPALTLMPQQSFKLERVEYWMLRLLDVKRAIEMRGYSPFVRARLHLDVTDDIVESNRGLWTVHVEGGNASVERGGPDDAAIRCDVRGLAAMYTGFMSPHAAALSGLASGPDDQLRAAAAAWTGAAPWCADFF